ncbi:hypothetical protein QBC39DRAFT_420038 [Podospora conica]|nr:hypothetical protein QBC39DRAFT_420038 [Schizothecium conicum]
MPSKQRNAVDPLQLYEGDFVVYEQHRVGKFIELIKRGAGAGQNKTVRVVMDKEVPIDRLVSSDIGYSKPENAVCVAFKAVQDGKQVAILVPSTLLAQQHMETFGECLSGFPVRVESLSRFQTPQQG